MVALIISLSSESLKLDYLNKNTLITEVPLCDKIHAFFYKQHFHKQRHAEFGQKSSKRKATL